MPIPKATILVGAFVLIGAASLYAASLSRLEALQRDAIIIGMGTAEQHVRRGTCLRYFVCIEGADPSAEVKSSINASYAAVRWCSDRGRIKVPKRCQETMITIHEPVALDQPVKRLEYSVGGTVRLRCTVRMDVGLPTSGTTCQSEKP